MNFELSYLHKCYAAALFRSNAYVISSKPEAEQVRQKTASMLNQKCWSL